MHSCLLRTWQILFSIYNSIFQNQNWKHLWFKPSAHSMPLSSLSQSEVSIACASFPFETCNTTYSTVVFFSTVYESNAFLTEEKPARLEYSIYMKIWYLYNSKEEAQSRRKRSCVLCITFIQRKERSIHECSTLISSKEAQTCVGYLSSAYIFQFPRTLSII